MQTDNFEKVVNSFRMDVMQSIRDVNGVFGNDDEQNIPKSFVGLVQVYSDKTATTLKSKTLVEYPTHIVLLNSYVAHRRCLIDNDYKIIGFLPIGTGVILQEEEETHEDVEEKSQRVPKLKQKYP